MQKSYKYAKVQSNKGGLKLGTVLVLGAVLAVGAVSAKSLSKQSASDEVVASTSSIESNDGCGGLVSGRACRIDAIVDGAVSAK